MAHKKSNDLTDKLGARLSAAEIRSIAKETGAFERLRKIDPVAFLWALVFGAGFGPDRTIAAIRRAYETAADQTVVPSSFSDRFSPELVVFLERVLALVLRRTVEEGHSLGGAFADLSDVLVTDATILRLRDVLEGAFPGSRTNHSKAAIKFHAVMSVTTGGAHSVRVTSARTADTRALRIGPWIANKLLLFDRGYYSYALFERIRLNRGYFVIRLRNDVNPEITHVARGPKPHDGVRLRDALESSQVRVADYDATSLYYRANAQPRVGARRSGRFRFVAVRDEKTGELWTYATNLPRDRFSAEQVASIYRARWAVELFFKSLKHDLCMDHLASTKPSTVQAFVYAAALSWALTNALRSALMQRRADNRTSVQRWARLMRAYAADLLHIAIAPRSRLARELARRLLKVLRHEARDPHRSRSLLLARSLRGKATPTRRSPPRNVRAAC